MPHKRNPIVSERICGLARVVRARLGRGLENVALWHERDISHSSAERIVMPDAFLAVDYMLDRFAWLWRASSSAPSGCARTSTQPPPVLQPAPPARARRGDLSRDDAYRLVQRHAMRAWDEGLDFPELVRADTELAGRVDLDAVFDLDAYTQHVDVSSSACARSARNSSCLRPPSTSAAARCASSTRSATSGCCSSPPTGSRSSTSSSRPRSPTRAGCSRGSRRSGSRGRGGSSRITCSRCATTAARSNAGGSRCSRSSRRPRLPHRLRLEGLLRTGSVCGHVLPPGLRESERLPEPIVTPATKAESGHDQNIDVEEAADLVGEERGPSSRRVALELYRFGAEHAERAGSSSPTRSSSSGSTQTASRARRRGATPDSPASGRRTVRAGRAAAVVRQAVRPRLLRELGWDKTEPGPELPGDVVAGTRARYVEAFER